MRGSFYSPGYSPGRPYGASPRHPPASNPPGDPAAAPGTQAPPPPLRFLPFGREAFVLAHQRHVPVFLIIGDIPQAINARELAAQLAAHTVPVCLACGERPDVEILCLRASVLFSGEGALPLCALLLENGCPFLAAPLPPPGYPLDPARLQVWLAHADRRFAQNHQAFVSQGQQVVRTLHAPALHKPYAPQDAAHDLSRALAACEDRQSGGFGQQKAPFVPALRFLLHRSAQGDSAAHASLGRALDAMLTSSLYDPLDGSFFRATLTDDWRVFVPQKPLGVNALLALTLLESGRRTESVRTLDFLLNALSMEGGALAPYVYAPAQTYAFTPQQVCAALGGEEGIRACRLLNLLHAQTTRPPKLAPSRFSPQIEEKRTRFGDAQEPPLCPTLSPALTPEDTAFLRRALPRLLRARAARTAQRQAPYLLTQDCALAAHVLAVCGRRLGEARYTQAAQRTIGALLRHFPAGFGARALPPAMFPARTPDARPMCGAACALSLALLSLAQTEGFGSYGDTGLRLLGAALHAFTRPDGALLHTAEDPQAFFPRVPAIEDSELPAPAAMLVNALRLADAMRPQARYMDAAFTLWDYAAPHIKIAPMAHAALVDAMNRIHM